MEILFDNRTEIDLVEFYDVISNVCLKTLEIEKFNLNCEISFSFVLNDEIKEINAQFRNIDKVTDVLSFPQIDVFEFDSISESDYVILGDIIVSIERAKEQASEFGHTLIREIAFLTAHSVLHLLGYDHMNEDEEAIMISKQKNILNELNITR